MRIVLMYLGRRGAGPVYSLEFTRSLLSRGIEILAIISSYTINLSDWMNLKKEFESSGLLKIVCIRTYNSKIQFLFRTLNIYRYFKISTLIREFKPDILLSTMIHPWHEFVFFLSRGQTTRVKVIHDVTPHLGEINIFSRLLNYLDIKISDFWIVLTESSKQKLVSKGVNRNDILVIPHAHFGYYNHTEKKSALGNLNFCIGFIGRIHKYKGVEILLKAYSRALSKIPNLQLIVAGEGNFCYSYNDKLNIKIYNHWLEDSEIEDLLNEIDIVVLPYIEASQSGVIPLAFAFGKPVIATNVGGLSEQVPSTCGLIIPSNNVEALSDAIIYLYGTPDRILKMGQCAYAYAYNQLSWDRSVQLFLSFFRNE